MKIKRIILIISVWLLICHNTYAMPNALTISETSANINIQLIDPLGNITGYDLNSNSIVENIPNTVYFLYSETSTDSTFSSRPSHMIENKESARNIFINPGKYQLKLFGSSVIESCNIDIAIYYFVDKGVITAYYLNKFIYPKSTWTYEFDIPIAPQPPVQNIAGISKYTTLPLTKVSQPSDLINDINTAASLNYIGNPKFVAEIIEDINEIEKKRAKMLKNASRSETEVHKKSTETYSVADNYREILEDITEAYTKPTTKKFVTAEGYNVLKEDLEYIIAH